MPVFSVSVSVSVFPSGSKLTADVIGLFGQTDATSGLEKLVLDSTGMDDEMARRLSKVTTFRDLKRLSVSGNRSLGTAGIRSILQAEFAPRLEALELADARLDASRIKRLIESTKGRGQAESRTEMTEGS